jgi:hypothetical protein
MSGETALKQAVRISDIDVVQFLTERGVDVKRNMSVAVQR